MNLKIVSNKEDIITGILSIALPIFKLLQIQIDSQSSRQVNSNPMSLLVSGAVIFQLQIVKRSSLKIIFFYFQFLLLVIKVTLSTTFT